MAEAAMIAYAVVSQSRLRLTFSYPFYTYIILPFYREINGLFGPAHKDLPAKEQGSDNDKLMPGRVWRSNQTGTRAQSARSDKEASREENKRQEFQARDKWFAQHIFSISIYSRVSRPKWARRYTGVWKLVQKERDGAIQRYDPTPYCLTQALYERPKALLAPAIPGPTSLGSNQAAFFDGGF